MRVAEPPLQALGVVCLLPECQKKKNKIAPWGGQPPLAKWGLLVPPLLIFFLSSFFKKKNYYYYYFIFLVFYIF